MTAQGTEQGQAAAAIWRETTFARDWAAGDSFRDQLAFPRQMAAVIIAGDNPRPGSEPGPGDCLPAPPGGGTSHDVRQNAVAWE